MGKGIGGAFKAVTNVVKSVLKSPIFSFAASFIPGIGPFVAMASKIYNGIEALKSGNIMGALGGFLGGSGLGGALQNTLGSVMGKASNLVGSDAMGFLTSMGKALGGNGADVLKMAGMAENTLKQITNKGLFPAAQHNMTRLLQYAQAQRYV
jgi:hypothetical protein